MTLQIIQFIVLHLCVSVSFGIWKRSVAAGWFVFFVISLLVKTLTVLVP
jgi:hypothetical protein